MDIAKFDSDNTSFVSKDFIINQYIGIGKNIDALKFETEEEANKKAKELNDKYNFEISKNQNYTIDNDTYKKLSSKLSGREKFLALNSQYGCLNTNKPKYKQVYFVEECFLRRK